MVWVPPQKLVKHEHNGFVWFTVEKNDAPYVLKRRPTLGTGQAEKRTSELPKRS